MQRKSWMHDLQDVTNIAVKIFADMTINEKGELPAMAFGR